MPNILLKISTAAALFLLPCCGPAPSSKTAAAAAPDLTAQLEDLNASEDLILLLTPELGKIGKSLTSSTTYPSSADFTVHSGLTPATPELKSGWHHHPTFIKGADWPLTTSPQKTTPGPPWQPAAAIMASWAQAKFGTLKGEFPKNNRTLFDHKVKFEGKGTNAAGEPIAVKATQTLHWKNTGGKWALSGWTQHTFEIFSAPHLLFEEVLEKAVPDSFTLDKLTRSHHDENLTSRMRTGRSYTYKKEYQSLITADSTYHLPGVSVVDLDKDGWDDLFVTARWGPTQMLRNLGNGTFKDITSSVGLHFEGAVNCSVFADFDNDGDSDVFIGRSLEPAVYMENVNGKFTESPSALMDMGPVKLVTGISVADLNQDGLLDVYLSTYGPSDTGPAQWPEMLLQEEDRVRLQKKRENENRWFDYHGPANVMLVNTGKGFKRCPYDECISQWRNSYQSAWADYDDDGDPDLYICNDYAPDALLRNDTPKGSQNPVFADVTSTVLPKASLANGMGASWGDFDGDADLDLFVSNMFSKAGNRIAEKLGDAAAPHIKVAASGNFLFRNDGDSFAQVAGSGQNEFSVAASGWAYGGQWMDFDNNSQADLYVPCGYYSPPEEGDTQLDL